MAGRVNCTGTVKGKITGLNRQCRETASPDQTPTLCHICLRKLHIAAESSLGVAAEPNPDVAAGPNLIASEFNPTQPNPHIAAEPTPPATPIDSSNTTTGISAAPIASQNAALTSTLRKAGQNVATTDTPTTPHKASQLAPTHAATHFPTPQKAIQQSSTDGNLAIRRDVFRNNLKELILVKMECEKKIDFNAPHDPQKSLKPLRPDIAVVKQEHLDSLPPLYDQFLCVMEHERSHRYLRDGQALDTPQCRSP
jgi:hypothetical protein